MREISKKDAVVSYPEIVAISPIQNEDLQAPKVHKEVEELDRLQSEKSPSSSDIADLLESFQQIKAEEQRLLEVKQQILAKQRDLQANLVKEIEKKKASIANLMSEIPSLQNRTQQLGQALGVDIYK